jgi:shikimate dehydrogenase
LAAVIGTPVRHSLSPTLFEAAFAEVSLDWTYLAFEVSPEGLPGAVAGIASLGIRGVSVTMPHKAAIVPLLDEVSPTAARLDAVNCLTWRDGALVGDNTDGAGLLLALDAEGVSVAGANVVVVGAGGAARAITLALGGAGVSRLSVVNRTESRAAAAAALAGPAGRVGSGDDITSADLIINATSVGMAPDTGVPFDVDLLSSGQVVLDAVYHPRQTPLLTAAAARGARAVDGVGMLCGQAAVAFERWTGQPGPFDVMRAAARSALGG